MIAIYNTGKKVSDDNQIEIRILYRDISYDSLEKINPKAIQFRSVISHKFNLSNEGQFRIVIKDIVFGNDKRPEKCVKMINFKPVSL